MADRDTHSSKGHRPMKIKTDAKAFASAINLAYPLTREGNGSYWNGFMIEARDYGCSAYATDGTVEFRHTVDCEVVEPGQAFAMALPLKKTLAYAKRGETMTVEAVDNDVVVTRGDGRRFEDIPNGFAAAPEPLEIGATFFWPREAFAEALGRVAFAMSDEETRYYLNGILFEPRPGCVEGEPGELRMVATDGHRLAACDTDLGAEPADWPDSTYTGAPRGMIVPRLAVNILLRALKAEKSPEILVEIAENGLAIHGNAWTLTTRAIDGGFPAYERVIPQAEHFASHDLASMGAAVKAAKPPKYGAMVAMNGSSELRIRDEDAITLPGGPQIDGDPIGLNPRSLMEAADSFGDAGGCVTLGWVDRGAPIIWTSEAAPGFQVVQMPIRV